MSIIEELTQVRKAAQRTQEDLAQAAGLTRMSINRAEAGTVDPKLSSVVEMARALGMELMLVPTALRPEVAAFLQSGGRVLGQPAGASAPLSIVDTLSSRSPR
ncbi:helix-turn-helix domain-containing protein [Xylophilus sp. Kf1]|nr:helix-turn-helix domain-containing protein [Xylophilus sp. Kf1]